MSFLTKPEIVKKRLEFCKECEYKKFRFLTPLCSKCGCIIDAKVRFENQKCPIGKW